MSRVLVDTGVFSASLSRRRRERFEKHVRAMSGRGIFLAAQTIAELRFGALVAGWGDARRLRLETVIAATTIVPVSDALISEAAELRFECRRVGHPLAAEPHAADLWIAASARHISAPLLSADSIFENAPGVARVTL